MIPFLVFSVIAIGLVCLAGRKDIARDPRLTLLLLLLLAAFPFVFPLLPKVAVFPADTLTPETQGPWTTTLLAVWALGCAFSIGKLILAAIGLARWKRRSEFLQNIEGVAIHQLPGLGSPVASGIFNPLIFVPENFQDLPEANQQIILSHELAHHRRHDPLWRLLVELIKSLHWYHPGVRWMANRFTLQSECACDELVINKGVSPKSYAGVLCDFAQNRMRSSLAPAMADASSLEKRVRRFSNSQAGKTGLSIVAFALLGIVSAAALAAFGPKPIPSTEVQLRLTADPFPGNP